MRRAFTYDWRMWTLPELNDTRPRAGFADVHVYVQGVGRRTRPPARRLHAPERFDNEEAWIAYVVGVR